MDLKEKASYVVGLLEGIGLDFSKEENKILKSVVELLQDMSEKIYELERKSEDNAALIDELDEDLANVEEDLYSKVDAMSCGGHKKGHCHCGRREGELNSEEDEESYEVSCPNCGRIVEIDDEIFDKEDIVCPECGEKVNFDFK